MTKNSAPRWASKHRLAAALGLIALVAVMILAARSRSRQSSDTLSDGLLFTVAEGPLTISVTEAGTIKPREQQIIKSEIEGRTTILYLIPEGTRVKEGDLLVELDASNLADTKIDQEIRVQNGEASFIQSRENVEVVRNQATSDVDKAELTLRFAGEDLTQYEDGEYPNQLKEHEARITLAKEEFQRAEETLKWSQVLFKEKYLSESELQADELAVKKAGLDVELAENTLRLLEDFTYRRTVAEMESNVKQAEMALERTQRKASASIVQAEADLRAKESEFNQQTAKLEKLEQQISKARIVAPRDGLVVYATSAQANWRGNTEPLDEGQDVRERQELIHLPTASTFMAEIKVHESNLDKIRPGMPVRLKVGALPGRNFTGTVATIAPLPDPMSMFMNPDLKLFKTEIHVEGGGDVLRTGMSCEAEIAVETHASALYIPVQAVLRVDGQPTAFVRTSSGTEQRAVTIGLDNNRMVHILDGLRPGERVLLAPPLDRATAVSEVALADEVGLFPGLPSGDAADPGSSRSERAKDDLESRPSAEERESIRSRSRARSGKAQPQGEANAQ